MLEIKPEVDAAISCYERALTICFSHIPDYAIAAEIYALQKNGIQMDEEAISFFPFASSANAAHKSNRQRLYYHLLIPPVFSVMGIGRSLAQHLTDRHGLKVKLQDNRLDDNSEKVTVLKP